MIQKLKTKLLIVASVFFLAAPFAMAGVASAANPNPQTGVCAGANNLQLPDNATYAPSGSCSDSNNGTSNVNRIITDVINVFSVVVGVVAVIMIIVGGFRYITSGGDSTKVTGAKNTILYALIGLVIVALAQIIVKFVLSKATGSA